MKNFQKVTIEMNRIKAEILNFGGIINSLLLTDTNGKQVDIVLGFDHPEDYLSNKPYFGAIIGRFANRIKGGQFSIGDTIYSTTKNEGENTLHGGKVGFDKVFWEIKQLSKNIVELKYFSPDGEQGFPGNLVVKVIYTITEMNELIIEYFAETDKETVINLTNHSYFNLGGDQNILNHKLKIASDFYTPIDSNLIPTGEILSVENTPLDFNDLFLIGEKLKQVKNGFDHNYILNDKVGGIKFAAQLTHPQSGREMLLFTTEPALQFYSGNFLDGTILGKESKNYQKHAGLCLETQHFPDSPNHPNFPSTLIQKQDTYYSKTIYQFKF